MQKGIHTVSHVLAGYFRIIFTIFVPIAILVLALDSTGAAQSAKQAIGGLLAAWVVVEILHAATSDDGYLCPTPPPWPWSRF